MEVCALILPLRNKKMKISPAEKHQSADIARLIMEAMDLDCCQYFAGPQHNLHDFELLMTTLVEAENSQYSYRNTLVALNEAQQVLGACVTYDGKDLRQLRKAFLEGALKAFGRDFSAMEDETQEGELYIDSLCVLKEFRHQGIASALLKASIEKAKSLHIPAIGLLVDKGNPKAEALYQSLGFTYKNDASWGGHPMKHLQIIFRE
jgi:ribosomal protein S18 acetylase RimI-like enzyme